MPSQPSSEQLTPRARALIDGAKRQGGPSSAQRTAITAAVMTSTTSSAAGVGAATGGASVVKLIGAGVIATVLGASGTATVLHFRNDGGARPVAATTRAPAPAPRPVVEEAPAKPTIAPPPIIEEPKVVPPPPATAPLRATPETHAPPPPEPIPETPEIVPSPAPPTRGSVTPDSSAEEVTALGAALEALEAGDPATALELAQKSRRAHPQGVLRPELMVIEIEALCALKRTDDARALAGSMTPADRTALVNEKLRRSCVAP